MYIEGDKQLPAVKLLNVDTVERKSHVEWPCMRKRKKGCEPICPSEKRRILQIPANESLSSRIQMFYSTPILSGVRRFYRDTESALRSLFYISPIRCAQEQFFSSYVSSFLISPRTNPAVCLRWNIEHLGDYSLRGQWHLELQYRTSWWCYYAHIHPQHVSYWRRKAGYSHSCRRIYLPPVGCGLRKCLGVSRKATEWERNAQLCVRSRLEEGMSNV